MLAETVEEATKEENERYGYEIMCYVQEELIIRLMEDPELRAKATSNKISKEEILKMEELYNWRQCRDHKMVYDTFEEAQEAMSQMHCADEDITMIALREKEDVEDPWPLPQKVGNTQWPEPLNETFAGQLGLNEDSFERVKDMLEKVRDKSHKKSEGMKIIWDLDIKPSEKIMMIMMMREG